MHKKILFLVLGCLVAVAPTVLYAQLSGDSFKLDPGGSPGNAHSSTSTTYSLDGSVEWLSGDKPTSTTYSLETGATVSGGCGDGVVDPGESCDSTNLNGGTCVSQGFASGTLSCSAACAYVTSACVAATTTTTSSGGGGGGGGTSSSTNSSNTNISAPSTGTAPAAPTVDKSFSQDFFSYDSSTLLYGTKTADTEKIEVNGSSQGVTYPTSTTWRVKIRLTVGINTFSIKAMNDEGKSKTVKVELQRYKAGDADRNGRVNDYDLSKFIRLFGGTNPVADFNKDGKVDDYDLSRLVANFELGV